MRKDRFYRGWVEGKDLVTQEVIVEEIDLFISADKDISDIAEKLVIKYRNQIEDYIKEYPQFRDSLKPLDLTGKMPAIIREMVQASNKAGVGPMASVAGAVAERVGRELLNYSGQVIVENGGDIFIKSDRARTVAVYAGDSPLTNKLFIKVRPEHTPAGICTSSGTVGHSLSFGKADACVIISESTSLADAVATAACNRVKDKEDIEPSLGFVRSIEGIKGALIVLGKDFGVLGDIELA